ncbi:Oidioi.mRNA.OKI2018_I69.chr1.g2966.t1.cds [Oikopleura dioica]|uniref:Oidioi.mRNA.OKI2018_I69.chr1.g2966.t1.cds n=1 Tax=Oikopleura dioica TaxID=34765 RepID=A0ABN7T1W0_OIKDI|nr:Oidioi.mRNA.OKI2018_I69.chr1.g2966.t1.cds [Oikopleura dioica]
MVKPWSLILSLASAEPVFGPKDKVEIKLNPEPLKTSADVLDFPDHFSLLRNGDDFKLSADIRVDGGLKTCGFFNSRLSVDFDGDTVSEFHVTPSGHVLTRSFDNGNAIHFSHLVQLALCNGNIKSCVLTAEQMSIEDLQFDVTFGGLEMTDSGKEVKVDFSCDEVIRDKSTFLHVWKEGQIQVSAEDTVLDSSDDALQTVASCNLTDLSPAVEMAEFLIGSFKKISQVSDGIAELQISGKELIAFGGKNIHGESIRCDALQMTDLSDPPTILKKYSATTKETIEFSYPTTYAKVSFDNTKFVRGMNYLQRGESTEISCDFDGFPLPTPKLVADGHEIKSNSFKIEDDASITCEAGKFSDTAYVNVFYLEEDSVELTLMQDPEEIYEGDIIELICHAHGTPLPDFSFYRSEKKLSKDDHHHYHAVVRAGNYSCTAGLDDFGIEYESNIVEIIPKIRPTADGDSLGMSSGLKIGIFILCIILLIIILLVIDFFVYKEKGLTNEALLKFNCICCNRDAVPKQQDEENPEEEIIVNDNHEDEVLSTENEEATPEVDPEVASTTSSSKQTVIANTEQQLAVSEQDTDTKPKENTE